MRKKFLKRIIKKGIAFDEVALSNYLACILILFSFPYIFIFYKLRLVYGAAVLLIILIYAVCILLNYYKLTKTSRVMMVATCSVGLAFFYIVLGSELYIQNLFVVLAIVPVIICNTKEKTLKKLLTAMPLIVLLIATVLKKDFYSLNINNQYLSLFIFTSVFAILYLIFNFYASLARSSIRDLNLKNIELNISNAELRESKRREHEAHDQALFGKIIRGIGHEIKNPLAGLKLWSDMLSNNLHDPEIVKKASQVFENNINRLAQRTAIMLKYTGSQKYVLQLFNLNTILNDLVLLFDHNFKQHDINFEFETMPPIEVYGSEDLLQSALCNIMLNALQFTPRNGTIRLSAKYSNYRDPDDTLRDGVEITISDTGPGISQDQLTEIFKPFITSHAHSENAGLGLAEVKKAMTYMYGGVDVFSEKGKGSRFMLYIPVQEPMKDGKPLISLSTNDANLDF